ncbi:DotI/IcmL/TraM family protein [Aquicella lusitana]|uniref:Intracellular multiplication protein IcmL n=1 Tax=Aquicella lusitana TaxID=254246 RepID=A0A370GY86_9COXI|nr:DotI/IcmL/TraM family protein [Aquicella lusitana]RDI48612.1 intracellular multiplication protein IcmL [Aquicella lusitana]VVC74011.1 hypothetical protein AQULUS_17730 [Aquicella lusitana]
MAISAAEEKYMPREHDFYRKHYHHVIYVLMTVIVLMIIAVGVVFFQMLKRPLPAFHAVQPDGDRMVLTPYLQPNLLPETLLQWGSKAATVAYTFDFSRFREQLALARPYFTEAGWADYQGSVSGLLDTIWENKLFINGVVAGTPVISNQGPLPGKDYAWRVQIPFLVTYQSANTTTKRDFFVVLTIVRVPTYKNPQGIGIDQFVMVPR